VDFDLLIAHFMQRLVKISAADGRSQPPRVSSTALDLLKAYDWPGNIAQLKSVLQSVLMESRGAVLATDTLSRALETHSKNLAKHTTENYGTSSFTPAAYQALNTSNNPLAADKPGDCSIWNVAEFVKLQTETDTTELYELAVRKLDLLLITQLLTMTQGNQAQAARILGMTRTSLRKKIQACHIDPLRFLVPRNYETTEPTTESEYEKGEA
jgi:two-component system nitrogen regulation response regulator GlnG